MALGDVALALQRLREVLRRRPRRGIGPDASASARWERDLRVITAHPAGTTIANDLAPALGGGGDAVSPGWLLRAGMAACATTSIAMAAAEAGIALTSLELVATSQSDTRGLLGMPDEDGRTVRAGPMHLALHVRIDAEHVGEDRLRAVVDEGLRRSPIADLLADPPATTLRVDVGSR
ncbi:MAG TPA: OsmC family protein [Casimicrobiaceae bacterium]|nr:OsmC family protein [Casimicrobiaceae bacterium]